jgi:hypothetical protein
MTDEGARKLPAASDDRRSAPEAGRRFRDDEATEILKRAARAEVQSNLPTLHDPTLDDLVAVAEEVGMDPAAVRRAAVVQSLPESGAQALFCGGQTRRAVRGVIDGAIPEDRLALARTAEAILGKQGEVVKSKSDTWVWQTKGGMGPVHIALRESGGRTDVAVRGGRADVFALTYLSLWLGVAAVSGGFGLFAAVAASAGPLVSLLGLFGLPALLARPLFSRGDGAAKDRLEHLTMELIRVADEERARPA